MKKVLKAAGLILALMVIYYLAQTIVALVIGMIQVFPMIMEEALAGAQPDIEKITNALIKVVGAQTPWILFISVIMTLPTYYLIYQNRRAELRTFLSVRGIGYLSIPILVIFALSLNFIIELLLSLVSQIDALSPIFEQYNQLATLITGGDFVLSLLAVGIIGPIFEEILFRGLVFGELRKITKVQVAIFIQALLFGIYHMNLVQGTYAFVIGILLGYVYYRSSSIISSIIVHVTINSSTVLMSQVLNADGFGSWGGAIYAASIILFIATGAFILINRNFKHNMDNSLYVANHTPRHQAGDNNRPPNNAV